MKRIYAIAVLSLMGHALLCAQTNATNYITNPSFEEGFSGWVNYSMSSQSNNSFELKEGNLYVEKWVAKGSQVGNASLKQAVTKLPAGKYRLTVAAQNLNQNNPSEQCEGAYIYAGTNRTTVYTPADYSVEFDNATGSVEIGFVASVAKGNWLSVDNFRLEKIGDVDIALVYASLEAKIAEAEGVYDADKNGAQDLLAVIEEADAMYMAQTATAEEVLQMIATLDRAIFAFRLDNGTPGTGTAPKVSKTVHYVPTGATQALVRATMIGSNVLEKGICWSTEHNPTVLDNCATESYSLNGTIFHVKGLAPATVYYLRPYIMNKTYMVAYGDEIKIVTHAKGNCVGTWDEGAPSAEANTRCRTAIKQTIEYFNEWTGIMGFTLSGHYGADTPTADCSYGGWMRIGPNAGNQAIGTVLHETGHGVGVGTSTRYADANLHSWKWYGREANQMYSFLENKDADPYNSDFCMVGDGTHAWGASATYDWFVNGADKDKHVEIQYVGGCALLYGMFVDGLNPTNNYTNGLAGYTYNFDEDKRYYIMNKDADFGLNTQLLCEKTLSTLKQLANQPHMSADELPLSAAWYLEYNPQTRCYRFKNADSGYYIKKGTSTSFLMKPYEEGDDSFEFQLMPDRTDVTLSVNGHSLKTHGYWLTWYNSGNKALSAHATKADGNPQIAAFNFADTATKQQWIILTEEEMAQLGKTMATGIHEIEEETAWPADCQQYDLQGKPLRNLQPGLQIVGGKAIFIK